jgi:hypothetical protein
MAGPWLAGSRTVQCPRTLAGITEDARWAVCGQCRADSTLPDVNSTSLACAGHDGACDPGPARTLLPMVAKRSTSPGGDR